MLKAAVVGASGYAGGELLRLLARHPDVRLAAAVSETYAGRPMAAAFSGAAGRTDLVFSSYGDGAEVAACDVVFLAQDNGTAMRTAPPLLEAGCKVIDLSADFRFRDAAAYEARYGGTHAAPDWARRAVYGLPELHRTEIAVAKLVGNPGCYPTAATLAVAPLLKHGLVDSRSIVVDAMSGASGAGRSKYGADYHFCEMNESVSAYKIAGAHRHTPEIEVELSSLVGQEIAISFTPHLVPITRGILATSYASLLAPIDTESLRKVYRETYANEPFVHITDDVLPATKHTYGTNACHIGLAVDERTGRAIIISAIDNLIKGAAGQAVQNMNIMCGIAETTGLDLIGMWP